MEPTDVCQAACPMCARETDQAFRKDIKHEVKTGWHPEFRQARRIEKAVKRWMGVVEDNREGTKKTIFITVGRMLRGASCPWSCVIRMDDYMDFKIGHQIELRSQNSYGPDGKHCLVFDASITTNHH